MPYIINKTLKGKTPVDVDDKVLNIDTSLTLPGRGKLGFGEAQNENIIHLLEHFASPDGFEILAVNGGNNTVDVTENAVGAFVLSFDITAADSSNDTITITSSDPDPNIAFKYIIPGKTYDIVGSGVGNNGTYTVISIVITSTTGGTTYTVKLNNVPISIVGNDGRFGHQYNVFDSLSNTIGGPYSIIGIDIDSVPLKVRLTLDTVGALDPVGSPSGIMTGGSPLDTWYIGKENNPFPLLVRPDYVDGQMWYNQRIKAFKYFDEGTTLWSNIVTADEVHNAVSSMIAAVGSPREKGIDVTYDPSSQTLNFDVHDFTITIDGAVAGSATVTDLKDVTITTAVTAATENKYVNADAIAGDTMIGPLTISHTSPALRLVETDAAVDEGKWRAIADGGQLRIDLLNDAETISTSAITIDRTTTTFDGVTINGDVTIPDPSTLTVRKINGNQTDLLLAGGESLAQLETNIPGAVENIHLAAESGIIIYSSSDNWATAWAGRHETVLINSLGNASFGGTVSVIGLRTSSDNDNDHWNATIPADSDTNIIQVFDSNNNNIGQIEVEGLNGAGAGQLRFDAWDNVTVDGNTIWHAGNDGPGSGLNADLLDNQDGSFYRNASNLNAGTVANARLPNASTTQQGIVEIATLAETNAGVSTILAVSPFDLANTTVIQSIGVGQTWQDKTGSRAFGTTYTNTTGRTIQVIVSASHDEGEQGEFVIDGFDVEFECGNSTGGNQTFSWTVTVPDNSTYRVNTGPTLIRWLELT